MFNIVAVKEHKPDKNNNSDEGHSVIFVPSLLKQEVQH